MSGVRPRAVGRLGCNDSGGHLAQSAVGYDESGEVVEERIILITKPTKQCKTSIISGAALQPPCRRKGVSWLLSLQKVF